MRLIIGPLIFVMSNTAKTEYTAPSAGAKHDNVIPLYIEPASSVDNTPATGDEKAQ